MFYNIMDKELVDSAFLDSGPDLSKIDRKMDTWVE
jgi:hypothetical protein